MRTCVVQGVIALMLCSVSLANNGYAQVLDKEVTLRLSDVPFEEVLIALGDAAKIKFAYSLDQLGIHESVSLEADRIPLRKVLDELLTPRNIRYKVHDHEAVITLKKQTERDEDQSRKDTPSEVEPEDQVQQVTGTVTDASQQPMAGVNIVVKGTTNGTTTDSDGKYAINAQEDDLLVFSFIGYTTVEIAHSGQTILDVVMNEDIASLDEVTINAGYYKTSKELQTGSIVKVEAKEIERQPVSNPLAALQGRVPGLEVIQQNGVPGGNFKVRIRGTGSLSNGNDPLYVVDGVPYTSAPMSFPETAGEILGGSAEAFGSSPLNNINPSDIESIEVLKDADATSIYGSRGANGVILITTKKGTQGKTNFDLSFYSGFAKVGRKMDVLRTASYLEMRNEAFQNDGYPPSDYDAPDLVVWDQTRHTDWQKELIGGSASINDARLSISGGNSQTQFHIGGGFHRESTVYPGSSHDQRLSMLASITSKSLNEKLTTALTMNVSRSFTDIISRDLTLTALTLPPNAPAFYNENGDLNWTGWTPSIENPLAYLQRKYESKTSNFITNATVGYKILRHLEAKVNVGVTNIHSDAVTINPVSSHHPDLTGIVNQAVFGENRFENWILEPQLIWDAELGKGTINVLVGATFLEQNAQGTAQFGDGFASEALIKNLAAAPNIFVSTDFYSDYRYQAFFGRVNYAHREKYILNLTARRDGSSRFGTGKQFAMFGAVGSAWIFSREAFVADAFSFLSFGKVKASYGTTGNDQIGDYQYLNSYAPSGVYQEGIGLAPSRLFNPDFAWEVNRKFELGLDLGFINDRLMITANFYRNRSSSQLVGYPLAPTTGFTTIQANFPATVQNTGIELLLTTVNIESPTGLHWTTTFNFTMPKNKLVEFPSIDTSPAYADRYQVGQPLDILKLYLYQGVDATAGEYLFADVNEDGQYDMDDRRWLRFVGRDFYGGLQNQFSYAGFQLDFLFQFVKQQGYNYTRGFSLAPGTLSNQPERVMERWRQPGQAGKEIQRFTAGWTSASDAHQSYLFRSTAAVSDASFVRLKNLSLSYSLGKQLVEKSGLQDLTIFVQGQNLLTITRHNGLDPEIPGAVTLPPLRTFTAGVKLKI